MIKLPNFDQLIVPRITGDGSFGSQCLILMTLFWLIDCPQWFLHKSIKQ